MMNSLREPGLPLSSGVTADSLIDLLGRIAHGDHQAFGDFYGHTSARVFGLVRRVLIDRELSEDVTQEVFIMVWQKSAGYSPAAGSPMAWLMMIAHRRAVDRVRSHQSSQNRDRRWALRGVDRAYDEVAETAISRMDAQTLHRSLGRLSPLQREAVVMAYFDSLTYQEVAEKLSIPLPTIKSRIRGGLMRLRAELEPAQSLPVGHRSAAVT